MSEHENTFAKIKSHYIENFHLLTRNEIIVFCYLKRKQNKDTGRCDPKQVTIAKETGLDKANVSRAVVGLEDKKWCWADESGNYIFAEKVVKVTTKKVVKSTTKSCQINNKKLSNQQLEVVKVTTLLNKDIEQTNKQTREEAANAATAPKILDVPKAVSSEHKKHRKPEKLATRPDLSDSDYLTHLAIQPENENIDVYGLHEKMLAWCERKNQTPTRMRLLKWLRGEREDIPMAPVIAPLWVSPYSGKGLN